ncbi:hypothetical protein, partial [Enterobacter hormaechei]|uniref:hypothetical protein n=1 Tax=Enterobacter hormaechei TaxID=158836 RepID=UPI00197A8A23
SCFSAALRLRSEKRLKIQYLDILFLKEVPLRGAWIQKHRFFSPSREMVLPIACWHVMFFRRAQAA